MHEQKGKKLVGVILRDYLPQSSTQLNKYLMYKLINIMTDQQY